jgi:SNF2 family DNA or RNA helicase
MESFVLLQEKFGTRLTVGQELARWLKGVHSSRKYMSRLAVKTDVALENLVSTAPKLYKAMSARPYQRVGARFVADSSAVLVADDPGLGKTLIALGGILEAEVPGPYLVIAPKTASDTVWKREITRWLPSKHIPVIMPELRYQRERMLRLTRYGDTTWLIIHPEMIMVQTWLICHECNKRTALRSLQVTELDCGHVKTRQTKKLVIPSYKRLFEIDWGAVVIDESHESLIRRSGVPTQRRRGIDLLRVRGDGLKIAMSGTPFDSKPHQLWGTLNWLDPIQYSAFYRWSELYWQKGGYTGFQIGEFRKDREKMLWDSLSAIALRRTKEEVAPDLPPKIEIGTPLDNDDPESPIGIWLGMEDKQARAYREIEELSATQLESGTLETVSALAELTRLKQLACAYGDITERETRVSARKCAADMSKPCVHCVKYGFHIETRYKYIPELPSNKFNWTVESLEEWGFPKNPLTSVVIVSFYTSILEMFQENIELHFKTKPDNRLCTAITGKTPGNTRKQIIDRFNAIDGPRIMLLNVKAGGTAITIDSADRMIFISETRIPDQQKQAEDRIHRVSNPRQCMYYYLRSLGTVDVGTALVNQEALRVTHRLLDERRGVEYVRQVMALSHR